MAGMLKTRRSWSNVDTKLEEENEEVVSVLVIL